MVQLAKGDQILHNPVMKQTIDGKEQEVQLFQDYLMSKSELNPGFHLIEKQGLVTEATFAAAADKKERMGFKNSQAMKRLHEIASRLDEIAGTDSTASQSLPAIEAEKQALVQERAEIMGKLQKKDGPMKDQVVQIWEADGFMGRAGEQAAQKLAQSKVGEAEKSLTQDELTDIKYQAGKAKALDVAETLKPGLSEEWQTSLQKGKKGFDFSAETMPLHRTAVSTIPGKPGHLAVAVMGDIYELNEASGQFKHLGQVPKAGDRQVDCRGLIALDEKTFLMGDMGHTKEPKVDTLRVVKLRDDNTLEVDKVLTDQINSAHKDFRNPGVEDGKEKRPRIKCIFASRSCEAVPGENMTFYMRTKHAGPDLVKFDLRYKDGVMTIGKASELSLSDTYNTEHFAVVGDTLISSYESEDAIRLFQSSLNGRCPQVVKPALGGFLVRPEDTGAKKDQAPKVAAELPGFIPYMGFCLDGVCSIS